MTRIQADLVLLMVALIWGAAFVAQKDAMDHIGAYTFVAARFGISALLVLPLAAREHKRGAIPAKPVYRDLALLCLAFAAGVLLQQAGLVRTTVTNAGFLTGLYVLFTAIICAVVYKQKLSKLVFPVALMSVAGIGMLSGGLDMAHMNIGDVMVLLCAVGFGFQVALVGRIMEKWQAPFRVCLLQYTSIALIALIAVAIFEQPDWAAVKQAGWAIFYAGVISGGIAYTLQVVAQQYTPASDSAVIMSGESVFAAIFGIWLMNDSLTPVSAAGCALIIFAILLVEFGPALLRRKKPAP